jgi:hypothetical protein
MHHQFLGPLTSWTWEIWSWGCRDSPDRLFCPLTGGKLQGHGDDMLVGRDGVSTTAGVTDHGWSGNSIIRSGQSQDGKEKFSLHCFFQFILC